MKKCSRCNKFQELKDFPKHREAKDGVHTFCRTCYNIDRRRFTAQTKDIILKRYGNSCKCCGEVIKEFLTLDHINGGGQKDRRERKTKSGGVYFYRKLIKEGLPDGFQILCFNCNSVIGFYGKCPHQQALSKLTNE